MAKMRRPMRERDIALIGAAVTLLLALVLRLYNIGWSFSSNGVDEGIMLERSLMIDRGYQLYSALPSDQAPLALYIGALFGGDVITSRSFVAALSVVAIAVSMLASRKLGGTRAMLATGILLAVDFALLRESRLFSLDAVSSSFLALSILPFFYYISTGSRGMLAFSGVLVGISTISKLLGVLGLLGMLLFMFLELRSGQGKRRESLVDVTLLIVSVAVPAIVAMIALGARDMFQGMVLDQGHRGYDLGLKLSIVAFFGLNLAYAVPLIQARKMWKERREFRYLLSVSFVLLAFMVSQPLTFLHHLVMLSFPLALLAGACISSAIEARRHAARGTHAASDARAGHLSPNQVIAVAIVGVLVSSGLGIYGLADQQSSIQEYYAGLIEDWTQPGSWVVSGDPLMTALADRPTPPELVNVGYRQYPELTEQILENSILEYNVSVVVVCYRLNHMPGLQQFLETNGYTEMQTDTTGSEPVLNLFEGGIEPIHFYVHDPYRISDITSSGSQV